MKNQTPLAIAEIENTILALRKHPLFYISQASKELFHSNFWFWLTELNKVEAAKLFSESISGTEVLMVKKEHNQTFKKEKSGEEVVIKSKNDLVFFRKNGRKYDPIIVIENKVKDFPTISQLARIKESFQNDNIKYILVTLFWTEKLEFKGWENVIRYNEIADRIVPEKFSAVDFDIDLINAYKEFCILLHTLAIALPINKSYDFTYSLNKNLLKKLNTIKLAEGYQKMRTSHFFLNYKAPFKSIICDSGINNQKMSINFKQPLRNNYNIGVQIEGNQFRIFVQGIKHREFALILCNSHLFFNINWRSPKEGLLFLGYNPDFTYQYYKIETIRTYKYLSSEIEIILRAIRSNKNAIEELIPA